MPRNPAAPAFKKLTALQALRVADVIRANAEINEADRLVDYHEGWSDERVAGEALPDVADQAKRFKLVRDYRNRTFGNIRRPSPPAAPTADPAGLADKLDVIAEGQVVALAELAELKAWARRVSAELGTEPPAFADA